MVNYYVDDAHLTCIFSGRIDSADCEKWEGELFDRLGKSFKPVIFDMNGVEYVSSAFLRICVQVSKSIGSDVFSMINVGPYVKKVLKLSGFEKHLNVS